MSESPETGHTFEAGNGWTMVHGDCLDVMRTLERVDHVICDPPYSSHVHAKLGSEGRGDGMAVRARLTFHELDARAAVVLAAEFSRIVRRWVLCFADEWTLGYWLDSGLPWVRSGVWIKPDAMPQMSGDRPSNGVDHIAIMHAPRPAGSGRMRWNGGGGSAAWTHCVVNSRGHGRNDHPTPKPEALMLELVELFTDPGETVLDPFAGSGTTGVACLRLGRNFIGIEKDEKYFRLACDRLRAEEAGSTLRDMRAGQVPMFAGVK